MITPKTAVVFGYGDMGIRCLKILMNAGLKIPLVVTHKDSPQEKIWFGSLEKTALEMGIPVMTPEDAKSSDLQNKIANIQPQFIFSFYYRHMIPTKILQIASGGAFNMHGSLLPQYRGRAPTNWAIVHGEKETGATLHLMEAKADAGDIIDQLPVPILENDTAHDVFVKTLEAAETILSRSIDSIIKGTFSRHKNDISQGSYFGKRTPADGEIKLSMNTQQIHNLVRAVAPPFPGAFLTLSGGRKFFIYRSQIEPTEHEVDLQSPMYLENSSLYFQNEKKKRLKIIECGFESDMPRSPAEILKIHQITSPLELK